jgi:hypothetical protein
MSKNIDTEQQRQLNRSQLKASKPSFLYQKAKTLPKQNSASTKGAQVDG